MRQRCRGAGAAARAWGEAAASGEGPGHGRSRCGAAALRGGEVGDADAATRLGPSGRPAPGGRGGGAVRANIELISELQHKHRFENL